jgi:predicted DNA-binding protein YlxM (UPF0122 family)
MINDGIISGFQMKRILKLCGYSMTEFANFLGKSRSFVSKDLANCNIMPLRYSEKLEEFIGTERLTTAYYHIDLDDPRDRQISGLLDQLSKNLSERTQLIEALEKCKEANEKLQYDYAKLFSKIRT